MPQFSLTSEQYQILIENYPSAKKVLTPLIQHKDGNVLIIYGKKNKLLFKTKLTSEVFEALKSPKAYFAKFSNLTTPKNKKETNFEEPKKNYKIQTSSQDSKVSKSFHEIKNDELLLVESLPEESFKNKWKTLYATAVGRSHLNFSSPIPCQDAAFASSNPRPILLVADGAGSASLSHIGANQVVRHLNRLSITLETFCGDMFDISELPSQDLLEFGAHTFVRHALGTLQDVASTYKQATSLFKCTLLMAIVGSHWIFWVHAHFW